MFLNTGPQSTQIYMSSCFSTPDFNRWLTNILLLNCNHLNQVCQNRDTSKTCRAVLLEEQGKKNPTALCNLNEFEGDSILWFGTPQKDEGHRPSRTGDHTQGVRNISS